ncbi:hypothetical protein ACFQAT_25810 [Undibacterium arcticum]|uniref:hypothetical protein n=1 Tax=Undibacterium arcticum TaxID=1762892 RepID=UPI00361AE18E
MDCRHGLQGGVIFSIAPGDETIEGWKAESVAQNYVVIRSGDGQDGSSPTRRTLTVNGQTILDSIPSPSESSHTTGNATPTRAGVAVTAPVDQVVPSKSITSVNVSAVESKAVPVPEFKPRAATSISWQATVGSPIKQVLKAWARAAQWELAWDDGIPNYQFQNQKEFLVP